MVVAGIAVVCVSGGTDGSGWLFQVVPMVVAGLAMNGGGGFGSLVKATTDIEVAGKTNARR